MVIENNVNYFYYKLVVLIRYFVKSAILITDILLDEHAFDFLIIRHLQWLKKNVEDTVPLKTT